MRSLMRWLIQLKVGGDGWIWELAKVKWGTVRHTLLRSRRSSNRGHKLSHDMTKLKCEGAGESGWWRWWRFWKRSQCFCCCCWIWWGGRPQGSGTGCGENHEEREGDDKKEAGENFIMSMMIYFFNRIILMICLYVYLFVWPILKYGSKSKGRNLVSLLDGIFGSNLQVQFVSCPLVIKDGNMAMGNPTYLVGGWNICYFSMHGNHNPNWLIFFRGVETTNQIYIYTFINNL